MKQRFGFVSNSSSSSFILIFDEKEMEKNKPNEELVREWLTQCQNSLPQYSNWDKDGTLVNDSVQALRNQIRPLIDPMRKKDFAQYTTDLEGRDHDRDLFLYTIGFKTRVDNGNRARRTRYEKLCNRLSAEKKRGFYIIAGQDSSMADTISVTVAEFLEECLLDLAEKEKRHVILWMLRP